MPSINEEYVSSAGGSLYIWNRDTTSVRDLGQFFVEGSSSALQFFDIDVASDGTVYGLADSNLYQLNLNSNTAMLIGSVGYGANALEITQFDDFVIGFSVVPRIDIRSGTDNSLLRSIDTAGGSGGTGPRAAGDLQLIGNTIYLSGSNDVLVGLNLFSGQQVFELTDDFISTVYGLSTDGNDLLFYSFTGAYRLEGSEFVQIQDFADFVVYGAADGIFPTFQFNPTEGNDLLLGSTFSDTIYGLGGRDNIFAGAGDDLIVAGLGADNVQGDEGYDEAYGGGGADTLGGGADTFVFSDGHGNDRITDFTSDDRIDLSFLSSATSFNTLLQTQTVIFSNGVEFVFGTDLRLFLENVDINDLTANQFIF